MMQRISLIGFIFLGILLGVAIYFVNLNIRARAFAQADRELATRTQITADSIDRLLQTRMVETFTFAALPSLRGFVASDETEQPSRIAVAHSELQSIVASDPSILAVSVADTSGRVILATDDSMNADWSARLFVREGMIGHLYASVPSLDSGEVSQYYSAPILDNFGNVASVLVLRVVGQELSGAARGNGNVLVVDEIGVRIVDASASPQNFAAIAPLPDDVHIRALAEHRYGEDISLMRVIPILSLANQIKANSASANFPDSNGRMIRAAIRRLETNPWTVIVLERDDVVLESMNVIFWETFTLGAAIPLAMGLFVYLARRTSD